MESDLVSVVITTYGRSDTLKRAIKSVLKQTYQNLEIIIIDDNANEEKNIEVENIIKSINNPRIRLIQNKKNMGGALARNEGIYASNAEFVAFLDDDDQYLPLKIEKELEVLKKNEKIALVYCWENLIGKGGKVSGSNKKRIRGNCLYEAMQDCIAATSLWLCRKKALLDVGGFTDTPCKQDSYVILKLLINGYELDFVPEILSLYGDDLPDRISTQGHEKRIVGEENLRRLCREHYSLINLKEQKYVEYCFASRLAEHYLAVGRYQEAFDSGIKICKHPFNGMTRACIRGIIRVLMKGELKK